jgi:hypothetical protein
LSENQGRQYAPGVIAQRIVDMVVFTEPGADVRLKRKIETAIQQAYEGFDQLAAERDEADRRAGAAERELADLKDRQLKADIKCLEIADEEDE